VRRLPQRAYHNDHGASLPEVRRIIRDTCAALGDSELVDIDPFAGDDRRQRIVRARRVIYWVLRKITKASYPRLGMWANKDHTTIVHAIQSLWAEAANRRELRDDMARILKSCYRAHRARRKGDHKADVPLFLRKRRRPRPTRKLAREEIDNDASLSPYSQQTWYDRDDKGTGYDFFEQQNRRVVAHMREALAQEAAEKGK